MNLNIHNNLKKQDLIKFIRKSLLKKNRGKW